MAALPAATAPSSYLMDGNIGGPGAGVYQYAVTYTAGGESLPSPITMVTTLDSPNPTVAPAASLSSYGPCRTYTFKYAWINSTQNAFSLASPASAPITTNSQGVDLAIPAWNGPASVQAYATVYISQNGGGGPWHRLPSFALPGTTWHYSGYDPGWPGEPLSNTLTFRCVRSRFLPGLPARHLSRCIARSRTGLN